MTNTKQLTEQQQELVASNLGIAYSVALRYRKKARLVEHRDDRELVGCAMLGLCMAARAYDSDKGTFSTYAHKACLDHVLDELEDNELIRTPARLRKKGTENHPFRESRDRVRNSSFFLAADYRDKELTYESQVASQDEAIDIADAIKELPGNERPMMERWMKGLNSLEAAKQFGLTEGQVWAARRRAFKKLHAKFGDKSA